MLCLMAFFVLCAAAPAEPPAGEEAVGVAPNMIVMSPRLAAKGMSARLQAEETAAGWILTTTSLLDNALIISVGEGGSMTLITAGAAEFTPERVKLYRGSKHDFAPDWSLRSSITFSEYAYEGAAQQGAWNVVELDPGRMFMMTPPEGDEGSTLLLEANPGGYPPLSLAREVVEGADVTTLRSGLKIEFNNQGGLQGRLEFDELTVGGGGMTVAPVTPVKRREGFKSWDPFILKGPVVTGDKTMPDLPEAGAYFVPKMQRIGVIEFFEPAKTPLEDSGMLALEAMVDRLKGIEGLEVVAVDLTKEQRDKPLLFSAAVALCEEQGLDGLILGEITHLQANAKRYDVAGYVRNLSDGTVEAFIQGPASDVEVCLTDIRDSFGSYIREAKIEPVQPNPHYFDFQITF